MERRRPDAAAAPCPPPLDLEVVDFTRQHAQIRRDAGELRAALTGRESGVLLEALVEQVTTSLICHFVAEEKWLRQQGLPGIEEHRAQHLRLLERLRHVGDGPDTAISDFVRFSDALAIHQGEEERSGFRFSAVQREEPPRLAG